MTLLRELLEAVKAAEPVTRAEQDRTVVSTAVPYCKVCRCLDVMLTRTWCREGNEWYRDESAVSDVRVLRRRHRYEDQNCLRPPETWTEDE